MQLTIIIWTLICATAIIAYPLVLVNRYSSTKPNFKRERNNLNLKSMELFSFDLKDRPSGWSFTIEIPELTEDILMQDVIFFYLETEETCLKLPVNNGTMGYTANAFKNIGKIYLTFKCIKDGVSNYSAPMCHLKTLKVLILKTESPYREDNSILVYKKSSIYNVLKTAGINVHDYEQTLEYLSNSCEIHFKGYRKNCISVSSKKQYLSDTSKSKPQYSALLI